MKGYWNLDVLYRGYDDPRFDEDQKKLDEAIERFRRLADGADELDDVTLAEKYIDINEDPMISGQGFAILSREYYDSGENVGRVKKEFYFDEKGHEVSSRI